MKIVLAIVLATILFTSFGFKIRQGNGANQIAAGVTGIADDGLEDFEEFADQGFEDTIAFNDCVASCTNPMQWGGCVAQCAATGLQTATQQAAADVQTVTGQVTGGATGGD
jgi:hypothetical protein